MNDRKKSGRLRTGTETVRHWLRDAWEFSHALFVSVAVLVVLAVAARLALPWILRGAINRQLDKIPAYRGRVDDVAVALWRGAYTLRGVRIEKIKGSKTEPFFTAQNIDFSLAWRELFHGRVLAEIAVDHAALNFVKARKPEASQIEADRRWQNAVKKIFPIDITYAELTDSQVHFVDESADPKVDLYINHVRATASGLRNRPAKENQLPAHLSLEGDSIGRGRLSISVQAAPLAPQPRFQLSLKLIKVSLPALNNFLRSYGGVDVSSGLFRLYMEVAARGGRFEGYAKPFFTDVKFTSVAQKDLGEKIWQWLVSGLVNFLKNPPRNQLASRIPFSGQFGNTNVGLWAALTSTIRNGFIHALPMKLEHSVKTNLLPPASGSSSGGGSPK